MNVPNTLTLLRLVLIPVFVLAFYVPYQWSNLVCAGIFAFAGVTDWLDGYLARRLGQSSAFGAFLDPVADKLMVAVVLVLLVESDPSPWLALPAGVIIGREIAISALREWMAQLGHRAKVAVLRVGKVKTLLQMIAVFLMIYRDPMGPVPTYSVGFTLLYVAAALTLWSMLVYLRSVWPMLRPGAPVEAGGEGERVDSSSGRNRIFSSTERD